MFAFMTAVFASSAVFLFVLWYTRSKNEAEVRVRSLGEQQRLVVEYTDPFTQRIAFPVVDGAGVLQGLVTRLDLFKLYLLPYRRFIAALEDTWIASVAGIMGRGAVALTPTDSAIKAIALMVEYRLRTIPIVTPTATGAVVVGVVTRRDLVAALKP